MDLPLALDPYGFGTGSTSPLAGWSIRRRPLFAHLRRYRNVDRLSIAYA